MVVVSERGDFIMPKANGGLGLKVARVFVSLNDNFHLTTLLPESDFLGDGTVKKVND